MTKFLVFALLMLSAQSYAKESGLDELSPVTKANLVCGIVDGKYIFFSQEENKVWYVMVTPAWKDFMKFIDTSKDVESMNVYTYSLTNNRYSLPSLERGGGAAMVTYKLGNGLNSSFLQVRKDRNGNFRLYQGENGRNGICKFLE